MNAYSPALLHALLRDDFAVFIHKAFQFLSPGQSFLDNWHIDALAWHLDCCRRREIHNLIITMPPRYLKSICASVAFPAFLLGRDPTERILCASYSAELAAKHSRDCFAIMESTWYRQTFPRSRLAGKQSELEFETTARGYRLATSVGGTLTGRGGNVLIIDDPLKAADAYSETVRERNNTWMDETVSTRTDDKKDGVKIVIQQRLHAHDLVGHLLEKLGSTWTHLDLPAIADRNQVVQTGASRFHCRPEGDVLHPTREPREQLEAVRVEMGQAAFAAQYQQSPLPPGGSIVDPRWFGTYEQHQLPEKFTLVLQSWDTATKVSQLNDYSVCTTWGIKGKQIYLLNVFRKRLSYPDLKRAVREQHGLYQPSVVLIEDRSSGTQLLQELKQEGLYAVQAAAPEGDKVMRLHAQTATVENGFVFLPRDSPWRENYLDELAAFPNSRYDDQVDSTSQALSWLMQRSQEPALLTHYRRELEKVKKPLDQQPLIKLKAPYGISHVVVKACQVAVGNDGIVQLPKEDAAPFIRSGWEVCPP